MARTSKRYLGKSDNEVSSIIYKAGIYTRLSSERKEEWREKSSSIETQILCAKEYALKENINVVNVYTDYEYSGTNFERPQFQAMMQDIRERKINCIIIRDLSRLGREYLEMGRLIDKVFPFLGVRFISISDKLDTLKDVDSNKSFEVTLKNIINDMYAKDISVKIKTSKHNKARNGYFIGSVPPYGYKVVKEEGGQKLVVDENVKFIVKEMFDLTLKGMSQYEVAKYLNKKAYASSMNYYKTGRIYRQEGEAQWTASSVGKNLVNRVYTGTLVQGVEQQDLSKGMKRRKVDESEYIIFENAHEPIISKEDFEKVLALRKERKENHYFSYEMRNLKRDNENRYEGLVINNSTGKNMYRRSRISSRNGGEIDYLFRSDISNGKITDEKKVFIMEKDLDNALGNKISEILKKNIDKKSLVDKITKKFNSFIDKEKKLINKLNNKLLKEEVNIQKAYEDYRLEKISKEKYFLKRDILLAKRNTLRKELSIKENELKDIEKEKKKAIKWIKDIFSAQKLERLSKELIQNLVEKVIVYDIHKFEIVLKFNLEKVGVKHE